MKPQYQAGGQESLGGGRQSSVDHHATSQLPGRRRWVGGGAPGEGKHQFQESRSTNSKATHTHTTTTPGGGQPRNGFLLGTAMTRFWMDRICGVRRVSARGLQEALDKKYNERSSRSASANHEPRGPDDEVTVQSKPGAARKGRGKGSSRAGLWCQAGWRYWLAALRTEPFDKRPITPAAAERGFCLFSTRYEVGMRKMRLQPERRECCGCRRPSPGLGGGSFHFTGTNP